MPLCKLERDLARAVEEMDRRGVLKGREDVIAGVLRPSGKKGPRYLISGGGGTEFIKMDSNSYLGLSLCEEVIRAGERAALEFGAGPGGVRFIHGTFSPHVKLEQKLAEFHGKESAVIFSSAYAAVCGTVSPLLSDGTIVISDELNHNSIINAIKLGKPSGKKIYPHLDLDSLERLIEESVGKCSRVLVVTDGVFSMRGDYPDLKKLVGLASRYDGEFEGGVVTVMDDSHGTGAYGATGRGTSEAAGEYGVDIIISTIGKALGVNGGYTVSSAGVIDYLRETAPFYIYSNPITPGEAGAAVKALEILDSGAGRKMLDNMKSMVARFKAGLREAGYEVLPGEHPIVAVMIRSASGTVDIIRHLRENRILAVGLKHPVVPEGDECVRLQVNASHTEDDLEYVAGVMRKFASGAL